MSLKIEDYALIGDCETACLVGRNGSIDWLCWPDFSSPACFAALMGDAQNGRWVIAPKQRPRRTSRKYREHTLILETRFETPTGVLLLTDFMPIRERHSDVVRIARCIRGRVEVEMELCVRFDYGRTVPWTGAKERNAWAASAGSGTVYLRTQEDVKDGDSTARAEFALAEGEQRSFALTYVAADEEPPRRINVATALEETQTFWKGWCETSRYQGPWQEAMERSLITLKALTYRPSGGIVAAPTTSLPELLGRSRNWDYRYCWLRDAAFTLESLLSVGYHEEAKAWEQWLLQSVGRDVRGMQIMYGMHGERHLSECELTWLKGYEGSGPVRIGNAASEQLQLDVYGEVADALTQMSRAGLAMDRRLRVFRKEMTDYVAAISSKAASGIWERRNCEEHYVYSKVMSWLCLNESIQAARRGEITGARASWKRRRDALHQEICRKGFDRQLGSFVQAFGSKRLDASSLLIPLFGFLPFDDERVRGTLRAIEKTLAKDGLVFRYLPKSKEEKESAFVASSFWLVQNLAGTKRRREAIALFERLLSLRNDVGMLAEEYDVERQRFAGNFPQALSHISLINAARMLATE